MQRPNWQTMVRVNRKIDLSYNVPYDHILNLEIKRVIATADSFNDYPHQSDLYNAIGNYYKIPLNQLSIGYGGTDILERVFKSLDFEIVYVVEPSFQMMEVYCDIFKKKYVPIEFIQLENIIPEDNSILIIANPNGVNGEVHDITNYVSKFKYVVSDEVYGDYYPSLSLLHKSIDNVIIIKSLSKSIGLAGFRCGFSVSSVDITNKLQATRSNVDTTSFSSIIVPKIIHMTTEVVHRMNVTKSYLEHKFDCKPSFANYVLFKNPNEYTSRFGCKLLRGHYRMALTDMETLKKYGTS
jgi:histidinol-phosphate/aromatic aminotransferase/cobyric acid decarboxylase-like protein